VSRRVSLPGADELFGRQQPATDPADTVDVVDVVEVVEPTVIRTLSATRTGAADLDDEAVTAPSGRVRHDEKITIYVTADELMDLEQTRLELRRSHGVAVDRGRLVREAIHLTLEDIASRGDDSALVRRLRAG
jgi:hypothetical protein